MKDPMTEMPHSPASDTFSVGTHVNDESIDRTLFAIARRTFLAWERLRVVYVAILAVITILLIAPGGFLNGRVLLLTVEGAVIANAAYFAGPTIETYIKWLGYDRTWPRWVMFGAGTLLSIVLVVGVLATELLPDQE